MFLLGNRLGHLGEFAGGQMARAVASALPPASFFAPLTISLGVDSDGSGTPTFTRADGADGRATVLGYAANATIADGPTILVVNQNEARFMGARRISANNWSSYDANGVFLSTANGASALCCDSKGPFGYLSEGSRTNYVLSSNAVGDARWSLFNAPTIATNTTDVVAPDGTNTATKYTNSSTSKQSVYQLPAQATGGSDTTKSFVVRPGTATWAAIDDAGGASRAWFNLTTGVVGTVTTGTATITQLPNGWYLLTYKEAAPAFLTNVGICFPNADNTNNQTSGQYAYVWGGQGEIGSFTSTRIPTTSAAVTRAADSLTYTASGNISGTVGTCCAEVSALDSNTAGRIVGVTGGSVPLYLYMIGADKVSIFDGTTESKDSSFTASATTVQKFASTWGGSTMTTYLAGVAGSGASFDGDLNVGANIYVGLDAGGNLQPFGTIRNVRVWNRVLTAPQIVAAQV